MKRDALLLEIDREALAPVLERSPELADALARTLAQRRAQSEAASLASSAPHELAVTDEVTLGRRIRAFFGL